MGPDTAKSKNFVRLLNQADSQAYEELMRDALGTAVGYQADPEAMKWTKIHDQILILGVFNNDELIAMMQLELITTDSDFLIKSGELEMPFPLNYPYGCVSMSATLTRMKNKNINLLLRYYALKIFQNCKACGAFSTIIEVSPRLQTLREMGYFFFNKKQKWNGFFKSDKTILMAILDGYDRIERAIQFSEKKMGPLIAEYPLQFNLNDVKLSPVNAVFLRRQTA